MRVRTLIIVIAVAVAISAAPARATMFGQLGEIFFGRHREFVTPSITFGIDEHLPAEWKDNARLDTRYWSGQTPVFQGTVLKIGVFVTSGKAAADEFFVYRTAPERAIQYGDRQKRPETEIGGLHFFDAFTGRYGQVTWDTTDTGPGTYFLWVYVKKNRRLQRFSETAVAIHIAPPLLEVTEALADAPEPVLAAWGLESYPTLAQVTGAGDSAPAKFTLVFKDGSELRGVSVAGRPAVGRVLGVFTQSALLGVLRISQVKGKSVYTDANPKILDLIHDPKAVRVAWVVKARVYSDGPARELDAEEKKVLATFPDSDDPTSSVFGLRNAVAEMATALHPVVHLKSLRRYIPNTAANYWRMYQVWTASKSTWTLAPQDVFVPEAVANKMCCVRLAAGGVPVIKINPATATVEIRPGLTTGAGILLGAIFHRPDRTTISASATGGSATGGNATATQSQQQQQEQGVDIAP